MAATCAHERGGPARQLIAGAGPQNRPSKILVPTTEKERPQQKFPLCGGQWRNQLWVRSFIRSSADRAGESLIQKLTTIQAATIEIASAIAKQLIAARNAPRW